MKIQLACLSLEFKFRFKLKPFSKMSKKGSYSLDESSNETYETYDSIFEQFNDQDPWLCCEKPGVNDEHWRDINYSCILLEDHNHNEPRILQGVHDFEKSVQGVHSVEARLPDLHYACSDVTSASGHMVPGPCCHNYWKLDTELLLVESSG